MHLSGKEAQVSDEQINIAIAETMGWKRRTTESWEYEWMNPDSMWSEPELPNYTADLNACHEFEKTIDDKQLARYAQQIIGSARREMNIPDHESHYPVPFIISATARQRCEAYLITLGK